MRRLTDDPIYATIPINAPDLLEITGGDIWLADAIAVLYHQMYMQRLSDWGKGSDDRPHWYAEKYVTLASRTLRRLLTKNYRKRVIEFMLKKGLLYEYYAFSGGESYLTGVRSKLFKIPPRLLIPQNGNKNFRKHKVTTYIMLKNIKKLLSENRPGIQISYGHEKPWVGKLVEMGNQLTANVERATGYIGELPESPDPERPSMLALQIEKASTNEGRCKFDNFAGRFYSLFTHLKKELRPYFRFEGFEDNPHFLLDFNCFQPLLIGYLLKYPSILEEFLPEFSSLMPIIEISSSDPSVNTFLNLCCEAHLYQYWFQKRGLTDGGKELSGEEKRETKKELFRILFGRSKSPKRGTLIAPLQTFQSEFPGVLQAIQKIKSEKFPFLGSIYIDKSGTLQSEKMNYKVMSYIAQKLETRIILDTIVPRLIEKGITPFVTIHDAFWLPEKLVDSAHEEIMSFFSERGLMPPSLSHEELKLS